MHPRLLEMELLLDDITITGDIAAAHTREIIIIFSYLYITSVRMRSIKLLVCEESVDRIFFRGNLFHRKATKDDAW